MTRISTNFDSIEFACKCGCGFDDVEPELLNALEDVRDYFDSKVFITSGCRCAKHNKSVGGANGSKHLPNAFGRTEASDFEVEGVHADEVADYLELMYPMRYGIGRYVGRTHLDIRYDKARWDKRRE